jgi:hypothetical protein
MANNAAWVYELKGRLKGLKRRLYKLHSSDTFFIILEFIRI